MRTIIVLLLIVLNILTLEKMNAQSEQENDETPTVFFLLDEGNQTELIVAGDATKAWLDSTKAKYSWDNFDEYDNRLWEYTTTIFDKAVSQYAKKQENIEEHDLWKVLTREQKVFWAFLVFNGDTDNGGVYQFMFNRPEFILTLAEVWHELGLEQLEADYRAILTDLWGKIDVLADAQTTFNDESMDMEARFDAFSEGYDEFESTKTIEEYYYDTEFKKVLYKKMLST